MPTVLALDISTHTGAAWDGPSGAPLLATWDAPHVFDPDDFGTRYTAFRNWLVPLVGIVKPNILVFEAPIPDRGNNVKRNARTARLLLGLAAHAEEIGNADPNVEEVIEKNVHTIKLYWTGASRADKAAMIARCRQVGWLPKTDHEADAAALWSLVKSETDPKFNFRPPILGGAVR